MSTSRHVQMILHVKRLIDNHESLCIRYKAESTSISSFSIETKNACRTTCSKFLLILVSLEGPAHYLLFVFSDKTAYLSNSLLRISARSAFAKGPLRMMEDCLHCDPSRRGAAPSKSVSEVLFTVMMARALPFRAEMIAHICAKRIQVMCRRRASCLVRTAPRQVDS